MIPQGIVDAVKNQPHKLNQKIVEGISSVDMERFPEIIDQMGHSIFKSLAPDFKYIGYAPVTPRAEYMEMIRPRSNKNLLEESYTSSRMYRYDFEFRGERLRPRYMLLPFSEANNIMIIRDGKFVIAPPLTDAFASVEDGQIFVPVTRTPVKALKEPYQYVRDGHFVYADTFWARLHYAAANDAPRNRLPQLVNYILAKMGFSEGMAFLGLDVKAFEDEEAAAKELDPQEWSFCRSSGYKPKGFVGNYEAPKMTIAIRKSEITRVADGILASFFYILDNCADLSFIKVSELDRDVIWKRALCRFIWKEFDLREALGMVNSHFESLEESVDKLFINSARDAGVIIDSIWDVLKWVQLNFGELSLHNNPSSVRGKRLDTLGAMAKPYSYMFVNILNGLKRLEKRGWRKDNIEDFLNHNFKQNIPSGYASGDFPFISLAESATDNLLTKTVSLIYRPARHKGGACAADMHDPMYFITGDGLDIFSRRQVTKSSPTASNRINVFATLGPNNEVMFPEWMQPYRDEIDNYRN